MDNRATRLDLGLDPLRRQRADSCKNAATPPTAVPLGRTIHGTPPLTAPQIRMNMSTGPMESFLRVLQAVGRGLLRAALALFGLVVMLSALLAGVILALGLTFWALLRGRRPPSPRFAWRGFPPPGGRGRVPPRAAGSGEVIDIEAREVHPGDR